MWFKYKFKIVTKFILFHLIYRSFTRNEHVKRMLFIYNLTLLIYAAKLNTYEINNFVLFLYTCMYRCSVMHKKFKYIKESIMRYISPVSFSNECFLVWIITKWITPRLETSIKLLGSLCWMHSIQCRKYLALITEQYFFIACRYETSPLRNLQEHSS